jgi:hypothetical protein
VISHKVPRLGIYSQKSQFSVLNCALFVLHSSIILLNHVKPCTFSNVLLCRPFWCASSWTNSFMYLMTTLKKSTMLLKALELVEKQTSCILKLCHQMEDILVKYRGKNKNQKEGRKVLASYWKLWSYFNTLVYHL